MSKLTAYETDFITWTEDTARALAEKRFDDIDMPALIDEVESLGHRDRREFENGLQNLIVHLLKSEYQPQEAASWKATIMEQRHHLEAIFEDSPSLKSRMFGKRFDDCYAHARERAVYETELDLAMFPERCPWSLEEIMAEKQ